MTAKPHGSATRASRSAERDPAPDGTISGETVAARSPQSLYFRGGNTVTPDQRETDPDCAASVRLGQLRPTTLTLQ